MAVIVTAFRAAPTVASSLYWSLSHGLLLLEHEAHSHFQSSLTRLRPLVTPLLGRPCRDPSLSFHPCTLVADDGP
jgi:hypothetical protein